MTVAEIVKGLLRERPRTTSFGTEFIPWSRDDYEKAWLVMKLIKENEYWSQYDGCANFNISPSDYAEIERRVREWEKDHG